MDTIAQEWESVPSPLDQLDGDADIAFAVHNPKGAHLLLMDRAGGFGVTIDADYLLSLATSIYEEVSSYDGPKRRDDGVYMKKVASSPVLDLVNERHTPKRSHFLFIGIDTSCEVIGLGEPVVTRLTSEAERMAWLAEVNSQ